MELRETKIPVLSPLGRLVALDGLRGIAALIVVCHHFCCAFLPNFVTVQCDHPLWFADTPLGIFLQGRFCVSVFFVLSGFVVSAAAARSREPFYVNIPLRYLRLALPAAVSVIFAWSLMRWIPNAAIQLNELNPDPWLSPPYRVHTFGVLAVIYNGLVGIFLANGEKLRSICFHNSTLWTMQIEAIGSIALYLLYGITKGKDEARKAIAVLLLLPSLIFANYACFLLGAWMMEQRTAGKLRYGHPMLALATGVLLGFPGRGFASRMGIPKMPVFLELGNPISWFPPIAAALVLYAVLNSESLDRLLSTRIPQFLGRVSFPLYLVHVPLLYTIFASVYLRMRPFSAQAMLLLFAAFLTTSLQLAALGEMCVDKPVLDGIGWIRRKWRSRFASPVSPITKMWN